METKQASSVEEMSVKTGLSVEQVESTLEKISESINVMADELNNLAVKVKPPSWITEPKRHRRHK